MERINLQHLTPNCFDEKPADDEDYTTCDGCGQRILRGDVHQTDSGDYCEYCAESN